MIRCPGLAPALSVGHDACLTWTGRVISRGHGHCVLLGRLAPGQASAPPRFHSSNRSLRYISMAVFVTLLPQQPDFAWHLHGCIYYLNNLISHGISMAVFVT